MGEFLIIGDSFVSLFVTLHSFMDGDASLPSLVFVIVPRITLILLLSWLFFKSGIDSSWFLNSDLLCCPVSLL